MSTIVFLHAHPDDEASSTAATMARAARRGDRVIVAYATGGEHGQVPEDLAPGQSVADYRRAEAQASAQVTGVSRVAWLGYHDSGMTGWEQNGDPLAFRNADLDEAAQRLADLLDEEDADVVVGYDWHGGYGHPDHVRVHSVAARSAELARRRPRLLESTANRDHLRRLYQAAVAAGVADQGFNPDNPADDGNPFGEPETAITFGVDVRDLTPVKRAALACHRSQHTDIDGMLAIPEDIFREAFGWEFFIDPAAPGQMREAFLPWAP